MFGARLWITLRGLSRFWGIWFRIPLRGLSGFRVTPGLVVPEHPLPVPFSRSFAFSVYFLFLLNILVSLFCGARLGGVLWHNLSVFSFPLPRMRGNDFVVFCLWPNKISCILLWIFFFPFHWRCCFPLYYLLPPVLVVLCGPFLIGTFSWMSLSGSFQIIFPMLLLCLMLWNFSLCCILHDAAFYMHWSVFWMHCLYRRVVFFS